MSDSANNILGKLLEKKATAELVVGAVSGKSNLLIKVDGKDPQIAPVEQRTDALLVNTVGGIKQAWGVAINKKGQLIVVEGGRDVDKKDEDQTERSGREKVSATLKDEGEGSGRIWIMSLQGEKISSFGQKGHGDGEFDAPRGVAVDDEDDIYVVDKKNSRIQKFSPSGKHLASVGKKGHGPLEFDWPKAVGIHPRTKNVYVTEANNHRVQILKPDLTYLAKIGAVDREGKPRLGSGVGEFNAPLGVAFDSSGRVYIADTVNNRIQVFTEDNEFFAVFGGKGNGHGQLGFPSAVCIDENDTLYVTEVDNYRISVFQIESNKSTSQHTLSPSSTRVSRSTSLPMQSGKAGYSPPSFVTTFGKKSTESFYYGGIAVDKQGVLYVTDRFHDELQMFLI